MNTYTATNGVSIHCALLVFSQRMTIVSGFGYLIFI